MKIKFAIALAAILTLAACSSTKSATEADFGNSRASVLKAQTADPATLLNPSAAIVEGIDPDYATTALDVMRENVSKPEEIRKPIQISVGDSGGN